MYLEGKSSTFIAHYLTDKKIKTPAEYYNNIIQYIESNVFIIYT